MVRLSGNDSTFGAGRTSGAGRAMEIAEMALAMSQADQTEVHCIEKESFLTRFANSEIHQNMAESAVLVTVRAVVGKRIGIASTSRFDEDSLQSVVSRAFEIAKRQPENPQFVSLPGPEAHDSSVETFFPETANFGPEDRALAVDAIIKRVRKAGLLGFGSFSTAVYDIATVNSLGVAAGERSTLASFVTVVMGEDGTGYAARTSRNVAALDLEDAGREAVERCLASRGSVAIEPGEYTVILDTYAVADMIDMLSYMGFGALAYQEGRSFMSGALGKRIAGENISIWDDGLAEEGIPVEFDYEGVPKERVELITNGIARGVVYDSYTAGIEGKKSTGHATSPSFANGPYATNLFMAPGQSDLDEMINSTDYGILVTRFHYTNPVHPIKTLFTGMTRDGTFLIDGGKISKPLKNLRFTQGILEALSNVEMISKERRVHEGVACVPALKIKGFNFTGVTEY
ncbi:MAG TPA: TldD/PmbA family protein [Firmicutes bacterium]|nr:TldD/PmbA family protein [Bacillota bacterium]